MSALLFLPACQREDGAGDAPPVPTTNVILISVDTLRGDFLGCYGEGQYDGVSPNIDALADESVLFENFISAAPWTTPAHMSLITSLYPSSHGVTDTFEELTGRQRAGLSFSKLAEARITLAEVLAAHGYATRACTGGITLDPAIGFDQGFQHYDESMYKVDAEGMESMLAWVREPREQPFFLFWHTFEVHAPYLHTDYLPAALEHIQPQFDAMTASLSTMADLDRHSAYVKSFKTLLEQNNVFDVSTNHALYAGGVRSMDAWLGRLVESLRAANLYDDTLIVFTSDHGDEFADHAPYAYYNAHGHSLYEELIRVPLIVKLPGQASAGTRIPGVAGSVDVMPTILDVVGIAHPEELMQGRSTRPDWEQTDDGDHAVFSESTATSHELKCVRTDRYKFLIAIDGPTVEQHGRGHIPDQPAAFMLFDLVDDPGEQQGLLGPDARSEHVKLAQEFDERLRAFASAQTGDAEEVVLDEETIRRLKALGYID